MANGDEPTGTRLMQRRARKVQRVGIDIDGVIAKRGWNQLPWNVVDGWEAVEMLNTEGLQTTASQVRDKRVESRRDHCTPGSPRTQRAATDATLAPAARRQRTERGRRPRQARRDRTRAGARLADQRHAGTVLLHGAGDDRESHLDTPAIERRNARAGGRRRVRTRDNTQRYGSPDRHQVERRARSSSHARACRRTKGWHPTRENEPSATETGYFPTIAKRRTGFHATPATTLAARDLIEWLSRANAS